MNIQNTRDLGSDGIKIVVAGEAGNGKTSLARTLVEGLKNEGVCIISAEAGLLSLRGANIDVIDIQKDENGNHLPKEARIPRLGQAYTWLTQPEQMKKYKWLFIDSLTEINQNQLERLEADPEFQGPKNTIKKYGELSVRMRSLCKMFRDLPGYNVVFTALVKTETDSDQKTFIVVDMIGSFAEKLPALFDEIFYLAVLKEFDEQNRNKRVLMTQKDDKYKFPKDRSGALERFEIPDLAFIAKKIRLKAEKEAIVAKHSPPSTTTGAEQPRPAQKDVAPSVAAPVVGDISAAAKAAAAEAKAQKAAKKEPEARPS